MGIWRKWKLCKLIEIARSTVVYILRRQFISISLWKKKILSCFFGKLSLKKGNFQFYDFIVKIDKNSKNIFNSAGKSSKLLNFPIFRLQIKWKFIGKFLLLLLHFLLINAKLKKAFDELLTFKQQNVLVFENKFQFSRDKSLKEVKHFSSWRLWKVIKQNTKVASTWNEIFSLNFETKQLTNDISNFKFQHGKQHPQKNFDWLMNMHENVFI